MHCETYQKLFFDYVGDSLPSGIRKMVREHLQACDFCRDELNHLKAFSRSITELLKNTTSSLLLTSDVQAMVLERVGELVNTGDFLHQAEWDRLFDEMSLRQKIVRVWRGLRRPPDSGEYKWARLQVYRLISPAAGIVVPLLAVLIMALFASLAGVQRPPVQVNIREEQLQEELKEPEKIEEPEFIPPEPTDIAQINDTFIPSTSKSTSVGPDADFSPQPSPFDAVSLIKSPVIMKGIFGNRSPGARGSMLGRFGGSGSTEGAVMRALRWLKKYQEQDGSWLTNSGGPAPNPGGELYNGNPEAFTGLALLTYLGHGETPAAPEFGPTVEKAIKYLQTSQRPDGSWNNPQGDLGYAHPIATYAMCEAYGMTKLPALRDAASKGIEFVIRKQFTNGGWNYFLRDPAQRQDVSVTSWSVQALKAAKIAGIGNLSEVEAALQKAVECLTKVHYSGSGPFKYENGGGLGLGAGGLSCAAVLSLQLAGAAKKPECQAGLNWLVTNASCDWANPWGRSPIYYWYYTTQAMFHTGGDTWKKWNAQFAPQIVKNQTVVKDAIMGPDGKMKDIGYWMPVQKPAGSAEYCQAFVYNTTLCALQLEVYYRYLPTYQKPEELIADAAADAGDKEEPAAVPAKDLDIEIKMP